MAATQPLGASLPGRAVSLLSYTVLSLRELVLIVQSSSIDSPVISGSGLQYSALYIQVIFYSVQNSKNSIYYQWSNALKSKWISKPHEIFKGCEYSIQLNHYNGSDFTSSTYSEEDIHWEPIWERDSWWTFEVLFAHTGQQTEHQGCLWLVYFDPRFHGNTVG